MSQTDRKLIHIHKINKKEKLKLIKLHGKTKFRFLRHLIKHKNLIVKIMSLPRKGKYVNDLMTGMEIDKYEKL